MPRLAKYAALFLVGAVAATGPRAQVNEPSARGPTTPSTAAQPAPTVTNEAFNNVAARFLLGFAATGVIAGASGAAAALAAAAITNTWGHRTPRAKPRRFSPGITRA